MILVTGGSGFIGSNLVRALNVQGERDIIVVDDLSTGDRFQNLVDLTISDYFDKDEFLTRLASLPRPRVVFHQGACSDTMEHDGRFMMANNYRWSRILFEWCQQERVPLIYASSAAVYGGSEQFSERPEHEYPLNVYGYSKLLFDQIVRQQIHSAGTAKLTAPVIGLRYFNVYGPREQHKGRMASVAFHQVGQWRAEGFVRLFGAWDGWQEGQQSRDFVHVDDVVAVNLWFARQAAEGRDHSGVYNCGSGRAQAFNEVAQAVANTMRKSQGQAELPLAELVAQGLIRYAPFPDSLKGKYQSYTEADLGQLRAVGCDIAFRGVETGVADYVEWLIQKS